MTVWGRVGGESHSPASALGDRRKANRSRSGCISSERPPRSELLVLPPSLLTPGFPGVVAFIT